ncbi:hypothetical protein FF38_13944 [Lucilia cuprina]|uniref:Uncharacterized protein n=1 Tax=Lucilia cuprina TaxID=7375 RepID=A0A0L0CFZ2_LUCCU|nr:hypothetical protein CVS40_2606 [Lucilia cuprina]KNC31137.1 hypothetical protein FF38_13944 [Lucilia cuprina]
MNILKDSITLLLAFFAVALAVANKREILVRVRPITRVQYESIMKINDGKPVITEGRLINSAITGLAGLAAGFQLGKYLPNIFGINNNSKGSDIVDGYPLCTIDANGVIGRQNDGGSYLNVDELTNSLVQHNDSSHDFSTMNCILVLDEGKDKPPTENPEETKTTTATTFKPATIEPPTFRPSYASNNHPHYHLPPSHLLYPPFYPEYSYYPYSHVSAYFQPQFYPISHPPIYNKDNDFEPEQNAKTTPLMSVETLRSVLMNKLQDINGLSTTMTSENMTKKPTKKTNRRPTSRSYPRPQPHSSHYSPQ